MLDDDDDDMWKIHTHTTLKFKSSASFRPTDFPKNRARPSIEQHMCGESFPGADPAEI